MTEILQAVEYASPSTRSSSRTTFPLADSVTSPSGYTSVESELFAHGRVCPERYANQVCERLTTLEDRVTDCELKTSAAHIEEIQETLSSLVDYLEKERHSPHALNTWKNAIYARIDDYIEHKVTNLIGYLGQTLLSEIKEREKLQQRLSDWEEEADSRGQHGSTQQASEPAKNRRRLETCLETSDGRAEDDDKSTIEWYDDFEAARWRRLAATDLRDTSTLSLQASGSSIAAHVSLTDSKQKTLDCDRKRNRMKSFLKQSVRYLFG